MPPLNTFFPWETFLPPMFHVEQSLLIMRPNLNRASNGAGLLEWDQVSTTTAPCLFIMRPSLNKGVGGVRSFAVASLYIHKPDFKKICHSCMFINRTLKQYGPNEELLLDTWTTKWYLRMSLDLYFPPALGQGVSYVPQVYYIIDSSWHGSAIIEKCS